MKIVLLATLTTMAYGYLPSSPVANLAFGGRRMPTLVARPQDLRTTTTLQAGFSKDSKKKIAPVKPKVRERIER